LREHAARSCLKRARSTWSPPARIVGCSVAIRLSRPEGPTTAIQQDCPYEQIHFSKKQTHVAETGARGMHVAETRRAGHVYCGRNRRAGHACGRNEARGACMWQPPTLMLRLRLMLTAKGAGTWSAFQVRSGGNAPQIGQTCIQ
jgi:hypothetical protein